MYVLTEAPERRANVLRHGTERRYLSMQIKSTRKGPAPANETDRFWSKVEKTETCWLWRGRIQPNGYGQFAIKRDQWQHVYAHRYSYMLLQAIPAGLQLDHLCRNRACVRPDHLEPVTQGENLMRGTHARITHCPHGHPYDAENTRYRNGTRQCHQCELRRNRASRARRLGHDHDAA